MGDRYKSKQDEQIYLSFSHLFLLPLSFNLFSISKTNILRLNETNDYFYQIEQENNSTTNRI